MTDNVKIVAWSRRRGGARIGKFLRRPAVDAAAENTARDVLADIRKRGDIAVREYTKRFDRMMARDLRVSDAELAAASRAVDVSFRRAAAEAHKRIRAFARAGLRRNWTMNDGRGARLGERFVPYDRIGVYVPGGAAPLASTVLMTVTLAKTAGVREIVACTPAGFDGTVNPHVLHALKLAGATEVYRVGGIQAIGLMAYGTRTIAKVQKIVGPGGAFVTAAKKLVYGDVALDSVAGPSEIAVLADGAANPGFAAADLLSQAEHGTGHEKALLVTDSLPFAEAVRKALLEQAQRLGRAPAIAEVMKRGGILFAVVGDLEEGVALCNEFAPEHLELMVRNPGRLLPRITRAGAVFLGPWTPECVGDYTAGPSHVLPTGGTAALFSGLTVNDFVRRISVVRYSRAALMRALPIIEVFGRVEGLDAHAASGKARFGK
ncbi:MAG: histidinol dehydrogenase [Kiritimatiellia bacterium]